MKLFAVILVLAIASSAYGKVFERCELARLMHRNGFPKSQLDEWVCTAYHESRYNTRAKNTKNKDGSIDYGIFQINNRYWCSEYSPANYGCRIMCQNLLDDDIRNDLACIKTIYRLHGFEPWVAWREKSQGPVLYASDCFDDSSYKRCDYSSCTLI